MSAPESAAPTPVGERVLVGLDGSGHCRDALRWALARALRQGGPVVALAAVQDPMVYAPLGWGGYQFDVKQAEERADAILDASIGAVVAADGSLAEVPVERLPRVGSAAEILVTESSAADLLVVGTRSLHGLFRWLGSVSDQVVRNARCTVVVVPDPTGVATDAEGPIVVGIDGSSNSEAALRWAVAEGRAQSRRVQAVTVWSLLDQQPGDHPFEPEYDGEAARTAMGELVERILGAEAAAEVDLHVVCDLPATGLIEAADEARAALVVVGARGVGGFRGLLLGSVANQVLVRSSRPVAVVREPSEA